MGKSLLFHLLLGIGLCSALLPGVPPAQAGEPAATIRINGSGASFAFMKPLIDAYRAEYPELSFEMENPLGSSGAVKALLAGALDFAVISRPLRPAEREHGAMAREYGRTPLVMVTENQVPKSDISTGELERIYGGKVRAWADGEPIRIVLRPKDDTDTTILKGLSPDLAQAIETACVQPGMIVAPTDPESNAMVAKLPGALGASALCGLKGDHRPLNVLSLNGIPGTLATLADGSYPLTKIFYLVTTSRISESTAKFLDFVHSPRGRRIAEEAGILVADGNVPAR
jgi:phosphate transport system substrate-binding protein